MSFPAESDDASGSAAPVESPSRSAQLDGLRADAAARLERISVEIARLRADRATDNADDEHDPEGVTLSSEWARLEGLRTAAERELADVDSALSRDAAGDGGRCADCGRAIPVARLAVRPTATRCVECAQRAGG